jgi:hypothetical protein
MIARDRDGATTDAVLPKSPWRHDVSSRLPTNSVATEARDCCVARRAGILARTPPILPSHARSFGRVKFHGTRFDINNGNFVTAASRNGRGASMMSPQKPAQLP